MIWHIRSNPSHYLAILFSCFSTKKVGLYEKNGAKGTEKCVCALVKCRNKKW